jgi:hypothetical protein
MILTHAAGQIPARHREVQMGTAISNALAFAPWRGMREFRHVSHNETIFLVVAGLAVLVLVVMAVQRRRRRWF